jgi:hypothetical protein
MKPFFININKKQKIILTAGIVLILITAAVWGIQGFHLFTHEKVMKQLPQSDIERMLEQPPRFTWINHFTLGLEYTLLVTAVVTTLCTILFFLLKNRKAV